MTRFTMRDVVCSIGVIALTMPACTCEQRTGEPQPDAVADVLHKMEAPVESRTRGKIALNIPPRDDLLGRPAPDVRKEADTLKPNEPTYDPKIRPSVVLDVDSNEGGAPLEVEFSADVINGPPDLTLSWNFGDDTAIVTGGTTQRHRYERPGKFEAVLTYNWSDGSDDASVEITVLRYAFDVDVSASPSSGEAPLEVELSAQSRSTDPDDDEEDMRFEWRFGDGYQGAGAEVKNTYTRPGTYKATVVATNKKGQKGHGAAEIEVTAADADGE